MFSSGSSRGVLALMLFLAACSSLSRPTSAPQPLPSPTGAWTMTLHQSGGFVGVSLTTEISSDGRLTATDDRSGRTVQQNLPADTMRHLIQLYSQAVIATPEGPQGACADCFLYDLQIVSGGRTTQVHADDTTLEASGASDLVTFLGQLHDTALRAAP